MEVPKRKEVIIDEQEAAKWIEDGMTVAVGGILCSIHPMAIVRQIIKNKVRNLTVVGDGLPLDLMLGAGCVKKVISYYVGGESLAPIGPFYRMMAQKGELDSWECEEGHIYAGLKAAAEELPFMPCRAGVGSSYPEVNPDFKVFKDPVNGETLLAIPAINIDVAILHAGYADPYGNVQHVGSTFCDSAYWHAAEKVIVEVDNLVTNEQVRREPEKTSIHGVDAIVRAPYGSHPYASPGLYLEDREHIREYVDAATAYFKEGDRTAFDAYMDKYINKPQTHIDYLEQIGLRRLLSLYEV